MTMLAAGMRIGDGNRLNEHPVRGIERLNGAVVVRLVGELDLYNAPEVRTALLEVCAEQPERLVVDLGEVDFVDSTALGVLIEARTKLENRQSFLLASPGLETTARSRSPVSTSTSPCTTRSSRRSRLARR